MPPIWVHGQLKKTQAETLLMQKPKPGGELDGRFLIWERKTQGDYALSVVIDFLGKVAGSLLDTMLAMAMCVPLCTGNAT